MSELDFALDGLYAAGWWPTQSDTCLRSQDQRWFLSPDAVRDEFGRAGVNLIDRTSPHDRHITLTWRIPGHGWESVTAQTDSAAYILAYTHLYLVTKREDPATIRH